MRKRETPRPWNGTTLTGEPRIARNRGTRTERQGLGERSGRRSPHQSVHPTTRASFQYSASESAMRPLSAAQEPVGVTVRPLKPADIPSFLGLIDALAEYEHLPG